MNDVIIICTVRDSQKDNIIVSEVSVVNGTKKVISDEIYNLIRVMTLSQTLTITWEFGED